MRTLRVAALFVLLALTAAATNAPLHFGFVSRQPLPQAGRGAIPGLGPGQRTAAAGGRLMSIEGDAASDLLNAGLVQGKPRPETRGFYDVAGLDVAPDGRRVAFAGLTRPGADWRLYVHDLEHHATSDLPVLATVAGAGFRYDDLEPCWVDANTLVFTSTRDWITSEYDGTRVAQLFRFDFDARTLTCLTAERNGVESPSLDRRTGRIVYSRWWFNRARPPGETSDDTVNVWQAISIRADGTDPRLVAKRARATRRESLTQPVIARDGSLYGTLGDNSGLSPSPGKTEVVRIRPGSDRAEHIAGAYVDPTITSRYGSTRGLASPSACCPQPLEDGRVLFSMDAGARGDWGVWIANADGSGAKPLADYPGTLELDAVPLAPWKAIPAPPPRASLDPLPRTVEELGPPRATFRFLDRNVFGAGFGAKQAAAARAAGPVRIRFWASLARPESQGGDTVVVVREAPVAKNGRVDQDGLPAGVPMFEQLIDAHGSVLRSAHGAAHVAGFNFGRPGQTASCVGCHRGHSLAR